MAFKRNNINNSDTEIKVLFLYKMLWSVGANFRFSSIHPEFVFYFHFISFAMCTKPLPHSKQKARTYVDQGRRIIHHESLYKTHCIPTVQFNQLDLLIPKIFHLYKAGKNIPFVSLNSQKH